MSTGSIRTPMLDQFRAIKKKYPDAILFYRMGDFYEMFFDDAVIASEVLGLRLTSRAHGNASQKVPLAGFPHHQIDSYLTRMVKAGKKVVIVEQVEDPKKAKGLVKRDVVQIATAGTNPCLGGSGNAARQSYRCPDQRRKKMGACLGRHCHGGICGGRV